jgi:hypothetical protein
LANTLFSCNQEGIKLSTVYIPGIVFYSKYTD